MWVNRIEVWKIRVVNLVISLPSDSTILSFMSFDIIRAYACQFNAALNYIFWIKWARKRERERVWKMIKQTNRQINEWIYGKSENATRSWRLKDRMHEWSASVYEKCAEWRIVCICGKTIQRMVFLVAEYAARLSCCFAMFNVVLFAPYCLRQLILLYCISFIRCKLFIITISYCVLCVASIKHAIFIGRRVSFITKFIIQNCIFEKPPFQCLYNRSVKC